MTNYKITINLLPKKNGQRYTFAYMAKNIKEGIGSKLWKGILKKTQDIDANLICYTAGDIGNDSPSLIYHLVNTDKVDGIISWDVWRQDKNITFFNKFKGFPIITLSWPIPGFPSVVVNSYQGMREIVEHLIKVHSFTKIAVVQGPKPIGYTIQRYNAYLDVVKENKIYDENLITPPLRFDVDDGMKSIKILLDERKLIPGKDIEAIVFLSDNPALGAFIELKSRNILVPEQIAITGCNAIPEAIYSSPPMTTITMPFEQQCSVAIDLLLKMFNNKEISLDTMIPSKIHLAQSCGCQSPGVQNAAIETGVSEQSEIKPYNLESSNMSNNTVTIVSRKVAEEEIIADIHEYKQNGTSDELLLVDFSKTLLTAFFDKVENNNDDTFLLHLDEFIRLLVMKNIEIDFLQDIITIFRRKLDKYITNTRTLNIAESLWSQARIMITESSTRAQRNNSIPRIRQDSTLQDISVKLITNYNIDILMSIIVESLAKLDIPSCYISLYELPNNSKPLSIPPEKARLIFAYENGNRRDVNHEGILYPSKDLLPKEFDTTSKQKTIIVQSLSIGEIQMGFIQFELGPEDGSIYNILSYLISSALKGAFLLNETIENQKKLLSTEKMASLGRLTAGIAHEMNTPLAAIQNFMKELKNLVEEYSASIGQPDVLPEDHKEIVQEMKKCIELSAKSAEKSISFIRGIKGQTASMIGKTAERFAANDVFIDTFNLLGFKFKRSKCTLVSEIDETIVLLGNPRALSQIVTNLVNNAIDAADGSEVTITVKFTVLENNHARLTVEDNGPGIPEENLPHIFDPLFTTKPLEESSGLGLGIVKDLVDQFKGTIKVVSSNGTTQFTIEIPVADSDTHSKEGGLLG